MEQKWTYGLWGAAAGAVACMIIGFWPGGWVTRGTAAKQADAAGWNALIPVCADAILGNPVAVAALKEKRPHDYDDVVRDHLKTVAGRATIDYQFRRDCGTAIALRMKQAAAK